MIDFHDPTIQVYSAVPAAAPPELQPIHPATAAHFQRLEDLGMTAHVGSVRTSAPMAPTFALSEVAAILPEDGYQRVVITPRRGTPFVINLWRTRGLVMVAQ